MSDSILQVNQIKDKGGNATGITVADTTANVTINNLAGGAIGSAVTFPAGHVGIKSYTVENLNKWSGSTTSSSGTELFAGSGGFTSSAITPVSSSSKFLRSPLLIMLKADAKNLTTSALFLILINNTSSVSVELDHPHNPLGVESIHLV